MTDKLVANNSLLEKILAWDMTSIVDFVVTENPTIAEDAIRSSEQEYKYFIYLFLLTGTQLSIPTKVVDLIWHAHILHTRDYVKFCDSVSGTYIHHVPVPFNKENFEDNVSRMSELSQTVFGNVVFDFSKSNLIPNVSSICAGGGTC